MSAVSQDRLDWLDATRGLAVLLVFLDHGIRAALPEIDSVLTSALGLGNFGVGLFFFCSGFIIPVSASAGGLRTFWLRRALRLYPLYWLSIALALAAGYAEVTSPAAVLANVTMFQEMLGAPHVSGVYWSLTVELFFYLLVTALVAANLLRRSVPVTAMLIAAAVLVEGVAGRPTWMLSWLATMCLGTIFYRWHMGEVRPRTALVLYAAGLAMVVVTRLGADFSRPEYFGWMTSVLAAYVVFLGIFLARRVVAMAPLVFLGRISYSVYLLHPFVLTHVALSEGVARLAVWLVLTVLLGWAGFTLVERPCIRLGRRLTRRRSSGPSLLSTTHAQAQERT